jgi:transcriptional regulator with XRE-family HTH domain
MRRRVSGLSQEALAETLELTCEEVQNYERGAVRVRASKLLDIARILQVPVRYFFDGLPEPVVLEGETIPGREADSAST